MKVKNELKGDSRRIEQSSAQTDKIYQHEQNCRHKYVPNSSGVFTLSSRIAVPVDFVYMGSFLARLSYAHKKKCICRGRWHRYQICFERICVLRLFSHISNANFKRCIIELSVLNDKWGFAGINLISPLNKIVF